MRRKLNRQDEPGSAERDVHELKPEFRAALDTGGAEGLATAIARMLRQNSKRPRRALTEYDELG